MNNHLMNNQLIYDLGVYDGEDSSYFLSHNFNVVGVEANPYLIPYLTSKFKNEIENSTYKLIHKCISDKHENVKFYISAHSDWSSTNIHISERQQQSVDVLNMETTTICDIIQLYGMPYYMKIDIEGNDNKVLQSLSSYSISELPQFISCESECLGAIPNDTEEDYLKNLVSLCNLGYSKFLLYYNRQLSFLYKDGHNVQMNMFDAIMHPDSLIWCNADEIKYIILHNHFRDEYHYGFWCDIIGTKN